VNPEKCYPEDAFLGEVWVEIIRNLEIIVDGIRGAIEFSC
jgi:hypothetical protein